MLETLYKTDSPEAEQSEYYGIMIDYGPNSTGYFVREIHGWWDEEQQKAIYNLTTLSPEEGYPTFEEAHERYLTQRRHRAKGGFVHLFRPHFFGERKHDYELIDPSK
jgi:hypothetical protein